MRQERHELPPIILAPTAPYRPGDTVTACWTLTNYGDAHAAGGRLCFMLSAGLALIEQSLRVPGVAEQTALKAFVTAGGDSNDCGIVLPELEPGESMTVEFAFRIERVREDDVLSVQAALSWPDGWSYTSPKTSVPVRLTPVLRIEEPRLCLLEGQDRCELRLRVCNDGGATEQVLHIMVPVPPSLRVTGSAVPQDVTLVISPLEPYTAREVSIPLEIPDAAVEEFIEFDGIRIESSWAGTVHLEPLTLQLPENTEFSASQISISPEGELVAGSPVEIAVRVLNSGRTLAKNIRIAVRLPQTLIYSAGSLAINGSPNANNDDFSSIVLDAVPPRRESIITLRAMVAAPAVDGTECFVEAMIAQTPIRSGLRHIAAAAKFPLPENYVWCEGAQTIEPSAERTVFIRICNAGTGTAQSVRLRLDAPELSVEGAGVAQATGERDLRVIPILGRDGTSSSAIDLGSLNAQERIVVALRIRAAESFEHGRQMPVSVYLRHAAQAEAPIGEVLFRGRSCPKIGPGSHLSVARLDPLRVGQTRNVAVHIQNTGTSVAENVLLNLDVPEGLAIERVLGAAQTENGLRIVQIPARASAEATVCLRVESIAAGKGCVEIHAFACGDRMSGRHLPPLTLQTESQSFLDDVAVDTAPMDDDSALIVRLTFRNVGDGAAARVLIYALSLDGYALNSTLINGRLYRDINGRSPLSYGLTLPPIPAGELTEIAYVVHPRADETHQPHFRVESADQSPLDVVGEPYRIQLRHRFLPEFLTSAAALRQRTAGPDLAHDGIGRLSPLAQAEEARYREDAAEPIDLPVDVPVERPVEPVQPGSEESIVPLNGPLRFGTGTRFQAPVGVLRLDPARIERTSSAIDLLFSREIGWYRHVFGMRLFAPERILGVSALIESAWASIYASIAQDFKTPLLRLVMPDYEPTQAWSDSIGGDCAEMADVLLKAMPDAITNCAPYTGGPFEADELHGMIELGNFSYFDTHEHATVHHVNAMLPELIPDTSEQWASLAPPLRAYKDELRRNFKSVAYMGDQQRHERMLRAPVTIMDDLLRDLRTALTSEVLL